MTMATRIKLSIGMLGVAVLGHAAPARADFDADGEGSDAGQELVESYAGDHFDASFDVPDVDDIAEDAADDIVADFGSRAPDTQPDAHGPHDSEVPQCVYSSDPDLPPCTDPRGLDGLLDQLEDFNPDPVDPRSGELVETVRDITLDSLGFPYALERTYRSRPNIDGPLGHGWFSQSSTTDRAPSSATGPSTRSATTRSFARRSPTTTSRQRAASA